MAVVDEGMAVREAVSTAVVVASVALSLAAHRGAKATGHVRHVMPMSTLRAMRASGAAHRKRQVDRVAVVGWKEVLGGGLARWQRLEIRAWLQVE